MDEELSRIEIADQMLEEANAICGIYGKEQRLEKLYNFLISSDLDDSKIEEDMCERHAISKKLLRVYKKDAWLIILTDSYEYLCYTQRGESINSDLVELIAELEKIEFTFTNLFNYCYDPKNKDKVKRLIGIYFEYMDKDITFQQACRDYNYENQTDFRNAINDYVSNVETMDFVATIFTKLDDKFQSQINKIVGVEDEEYSEDGADELSEEIEQEEDIEEEDEEYKAAVDELFEGHEVQIKQVLKNFSIELNQKVMDFLEKFLEEKFACDDFIGFLLSYVYVFLIKAKRLTVEETALLNLLNHQEVSYPELIQPFYDNPEYLLSILDVFCDAYYSKSCDILELRDNLTDYRNQDRIALLDKNYPEKSKPIVQLSPNLLPEVYDMVYMKFKQDYPGEYLHQLYCALMGMKYDAIFYEFDLDENIIFHRTMMIRYFSRIFFEQMCCKGFINIDKEEYDALMSLALDDINIAVIINNFDKHGIRILSSYELSFDQNIVDQKSIVKKLAELKLLGRVAKIDPMILSDSAYYRALTDTDLYSYLESNGIIKTVAYLNELAKSDYQRAREFLNEIMISIYTMAKEKTDRDSIEQMVVMSYESDDSNIEDYIRVLFSDSAMLYQIVEKYYENEKEIEFPTNYKDRILKYPKVKKKFFPNMR